jgi:transposase
VEEGDLILRDLGYFSRDVFSVFMDQKAFFLSRLESQTVVLHEKSRKRVSFKQLYNEMQEQGIDEKELEVRLGTDRQIKVRLLVRVVPDQIYEKRVREREKQNKSNPRKQHRKSGSTQDLQMKDETRARYRFTLLITNIDKEDLPLSKALPLYRVRWQVELVFKSWKSSLHVDKTQCMKKERFLSLLMAKLILAAISLQVFFRVQAAMMKMMKYGECKKGIRAGRKKEKKKGGKLLQSTTAYPG